MGKAMKAKPRGGVMKAGPVLKKPAAAGGGALAAGSGVRGLGLALGSAAGSPPAVRGLGAVVPRDVGLSVGMWYDDTNMSEFFARRKHLLRGTVLTLELAGSPSPVLASVTVPATF